MLPNLTTGADIGGAATYVANEFGTETGRTRVAHIEGLNVGTDDPPVSQPPSCSFRGA